jgi:signal transduction histidine kinase
MDTVAPSNPSPSLRILLVEDSVDDAELLGLELLQQGYATRMTRVETPEALDAALEGAAWDVVLCDHRLPRMDALSALSIVQAHGQDVPFVIVSNVISESDAVEVMRAGAHDFLFKHSLGRLGAVIEREVREAGLREERRRMQEQLLLADRLTSVGMLAAGVAHEINNPLTYVYGNVEFALHRLATHAAKNRELEEVVQALEHAREGSERIRHITRDLRVFCRTSDNEPKAALDVRKVMESSISMAWNEMRHRARLTRSFEGVPHVAGDQSRLGQVFLNLLVNAAQALPDDRVEQNEITVSIHAQAGTVVIEVHDNGSGMTQTEQKRAFEAFFTTKPRGVGSGIGLSICSSIVSEMGGTIEVESRSGAGTTFRVRLPAHESAALSSLPPRAEAHSLPASRILVIDDEPALCAVIRRLLHHEHEIVGFVDASAALDHLRRDNAFDLVICDIMMPNMSGIEFFGQLKKAEPQLAKRTLFMTGGAFTLPTRQFLGTVPNQLLEKPFETNALHAAIARVLEASAVTSGTWITRRVGQTG